MQPCACSGSAKWAHEHCLGEWRRTSVNEEAACRCGQCKNRYRDELSLELLSARLQAERTNGEDKAFLAGTLGALAKELQVQGKFDEAVPLFREALEGLRETLGDQNPYTLYFINNLGNLLQGKGDLAAAEPLFREALEVARETQGNQHPSMIFSSSNLSDLLKIKGDLAAAEPLLLEALFWGRETFGDRDPRTLRIITWARYWKTRVTSPPLSRCTERRWRAA